MKKALVAAAVAAACSAPLLALAQAPAAKAEPEFTISGNLTIGSDYRFRGFSQTDYQPTIQGGVDFAHKSGFYLGNWNSNVSSTLYNGAPIEMDFYGGYKHSFGDFGLDVGVIYYYYPGTGEYNPDFEAKNFEAYIGGSWGPASVKYYYAFTDFFGVKAPGYNTKGSQYVDISGTLPARRRLCHRRARRLAVREELRKHQHRAQQGQRVGLQARRHVGHHGLGLDSGCLLGRHQREGLLHDG